MKNILIAAIAIGLALGPAGGQAFAKTKAEREAAKSERQEKKAERQDRKADRHHMTKAQQDAMSKMSPAQKAYVKDHIAFANDGRPYIDPDRGPIPSSKANLAAMMGAKINFSVGIKQGSSISHLQLGRSSDKVSGGSRNGATSDH